MDDVLEALVDPDDIAAVIVQLESILLQMDADAGGAILLSGLPLDEAHNLNLHEIWIPHLRALSALIEPHDWISEVASICGLAGLQAIGFINSVRWFQTLAQEVQPDIPPPMDDDEIPQHFIPTFLGAFHCLKCTYAPWVPTYMDRDEWPGNLELWATLNIHLFLAIIEHWPWPSLTEHPLAQTDPPEGTSQPFAT